MPTRIDKLIALLQDSHNINEEVLGLETFFQFQKVYNQESFAISNISISDEQQNSVSFFATFDTLLDIEDVEADFFIFDLKDKRHCLIKITLSDDLKLDTYFDYLTSENEYGISSMIGDYAEDLNYVEDHVQIFSSYDHGEDFKDEFPDDWSVPLLYATDIYKGINAPVELIPHDDSTHFFNELFPELLFPEHITAHSLSYYKEDALRFQMFHDCDVHLDLSPIPINFYLHRFGFDFPVDNRGEWYPSVFFDGDVEIGKDSSSFSFSFHSHFDIYHEVLIIDCLDFPSLDDFLESLNLDITDHLPVPFDSLLSIELTELKIGIDIRSKQVSGIYLTSSVEKENAIPIIPDILSIVPTLEVGIDNPFNEIYRSIDGLLTGHWELAGKHLVTTISFPDYHIYAGLEDGESLDTTTLTTWLKEHSEIPDALLPDVDFSKLALSGNVTQKSYSFELEASSNWEIGPLDIEEVHFNMELIEGSKSFFISSELKIDPVHIFLSATYSKDEGFQFEGSTGPGEDIPVGDLLDALVVKMGADEFFLPDAIHSLTMRDLLVEFDTKGNYKFSILTMMEIEGQEQSLYVHLQKTTDKKAKTNEWEVVGSLYLGIGIELDIGFKTKGENKTILGTLTPAHPLKISSSELIEKLAPSLASSVPFDVNLTLKGLLLAMHVDSPEEKKDFLFRLLFDMDVGLEGIPLVGSMLPDSLGFADAKLLAANRDWKDKDIADANALLSQFTTSPAVIAKGGDSTSGSIVQDGLSISGVFKITDALQYPMSLHLGGKKSEEVGDDSTEEGPKSKNVSKSANDNTTTKPGKDSQQHVGKKIGPVNFKKVALAFHDGRIGLKMTAGLALTSFEFDLLGLEITVPQTVLNDPSKLEDIHFGLDGFAANIHKGNLAIAGAFLRKHYPALGGNSAYDEYDGVVQVDYAPFSLTGMGSYADFNGHTSLFLFVALGYPLTVNPSLIITGMSLGFGIHRDFVLPKIDQVHNHPMVQASVSPPPTIDIEAMVDSMHKYFPPMEDQFFVVAGIKFKALGIVDTLALVTVKLGRQMEVDLMGVSSILYGATFIEMEWMAKIVPDEGYFYMGGNLTDRSFLMIPTAKLTGGFAVAFWTKHEHQGDFIISIGGYHPKFAVPSHYPKNISRLGINFTMGGILTIKGGAYFAVTSQALMLGGFLEATLHMGIVSGYMKMTVDVLIWYEPFHYDAMIGVDIGIRVNIPLLFFTLHINMHLHIGVHIWGPDFAGDAYIDVGVKTFRVPFGNPSGAKAIPLGWGDFKKKFLQTIDSEDQIKDNVCSVAITGGLIRKVQTSDGDVYVVNPKEVMIEAKTTIPFTKKEGEEMSSDVYYFPGITPMGIVKEGYTADFYAIITGKEDQEDTTNRNVFTTKVPSAIWGKEGLVKINEPTSKDSLIDHALNGLLITPRDVESGESHEMHKEELAFNTDKFFIDRVASSQFVPMTEKYVASKPVSTYFEFTGLSKEEVIKVERETLLDEPQLVDC